MGLSIEGKLTSILPVESGTSKAGKDWKKPAAAAAGSMPPPPVNMNPADEASEEDDLPF